MMRANWPGFRPAILVSSTHTEAHNSSVETTWKMHVPAAMTSPTTWSRRTIRPSNGLEMMVLSSNVLLVPQSVLGRNHLVLGLGDRGGRSFKIGLGDFELLAGSIHFQLSSG